MVMMDDERNRRLFNETRAACLLRKSVLKGMESHCEIKSEGIQVCLENKSGSCPLWVFIKNITKVNY